MMLLIAGCCSLYSSAQQWPYSIPVSQGTIVVYQPQPQSFNNNQLSAIAAVSFQKKGADPVFGAVWIDASVLTDRDTRIVTLQALKVSDARFPGTADSTKLLQLRNLLEQELPRHQLHISLDELLSELAENNPGAAAEAGLKNDPPKIIFKEQNSLLVTIDGEPKVQADKTLGVSRVVNTPFVIVQEKAGHPFYLFVGGRWFSASHTTSPWSYAKNPPSAIQKVGKQIMANNKETPLSLDSLPEIIVSTVPAELIQSNGTPDFAPVAGTGLLYMSNSADNIFMQISSQEYYVLLAGRWYLSRSLQGPWDYVAPADLPKDFASIPEGTQKDVVLASVPGTPAAKEAVMDAQVPQTAKVDRKKATTTVTYDGTPKFAAVSNTGLEYAVNTASTVLKEGNVYYVVDKGVWFTGNSPNGPWTAATSRPAEVDKIPPSSPVYNIKYVYIYDVTPDVIYMGYTPGYTGCYVMGPTVVYGTGYNYAPWYGSMYYPRPVTWGFGMSYNPWTGWSIGFGMSVGFFHFGIGYNFGGGWWGPPVFHPPFFYPYPHVYGPVVVNNIHVNNFYNHTNIYNHRTDVITHDRNLSGATQGRISRATQGNLSGATQGRISRATQGNLSGATQGAVSRARSGNLSGAVQADRNGNVFQRNSDGGWQQRQGNQWRPATNGASRQQMEQQFQQRQRGWQHSQNFQSFQRPQGNFRSGGFQRRH
ncbi:DUF3300 domain-containing protein [Chitinophaga arvensicola]|uniref:DUF3300 domain-containing protein n=1 Tax=Chitinophaga arvensicola TaxID=29529 RepID=UPI00115FAFBA|nr:DUF3300 domain-containing protein [Chitinophaga arvensicola]